MNRLRRFLSVFAVSLALSSAAGLAEVPVGGQVIGPDGQGLEGIRVGLEPIRPDFDRVAMRLDGEVGPGSVVEATTDAEGYFELLAPSLGAWKVVVASGQDGEITSRAPDYVAQEYVLRPLSDVTELPPVALPRASVLEIKVLDEEGAPVDARLGLTDRRRTQGWRTRLHLARTGEDGVVRLPRIAGEELRLEVLGPSHPLVIFSGDDLAENDGSVELRLPPGGLVGTALVTDPRGRGAAGAVAYQGTGTVPLGRTGDDGRLRVVVAPPEHEPPGVSFVTEDGYLGHFEPRFKAGEANEVTVALEPLRRVRGQVIDLESRDPVAGALVWAPRGPVAVTDSHGYYELPLFPSPRLMAWAVAPGYGQVVERKELEGPDSEDGPTLALPPAAAVQGLVVDSEGLPISGVDVTAVAASDMIRYSSPALRYGNPSTRSTRRGRFYLSGLPPSASYEIRFRKEGFAPAEHKVEGLQAFEDRSGLRVVLTSGVAGVGWVVDETEAPVARAEVRLVPVELGDPRIYYRRSSGAEDDDLATSHTDQEGRFRLSHLASGRYNLEVEAPGFTPAAVPGLSIGAETGEVDFGTVVLVPGARLEGIVRDSAGSPVAQAEVYLAEGQRFSGRGEPKTRSDAAGRFAVEDLRAGESYFLAVTKSGYSSETLRVAAKAGETIEVVLRPAGAVAGHVLDEDADPVAGASVYAMPNAQDTFHLSSRRPVRTDEEGAFRLEDVEPGTVNLSVQAQGYQRYQLQDLKVPVQGEVGGLEIVLLRGATVVGTVTEADGTPAVKAAVTWSPDRESAMYGGFQARVEADGEGRFRLDGIAPGSAVIGAQLGDHRRVSKTVEVRPGSQTVDLAFEAGFEITGRVTDTSGRPLAGAALTLAFTAENRGIRSFSYGDQPVTTGPDGTYVLEDVAAGHYLLSASKEGYAQAATPEPFEVGRGPSVVIELELGRGARLSGRILGLELDELAEVLVQASGGKAGGGVGRGIVDFEGRYTLPNLGPGPWYVMAQMRDSGRQASGRVTVDEGAAEVELDLEFKTGHTVAGVVRSGGEPAGGVQVFANGMEEGLVHVQSVTGSDGRFLLAHLPAGKYRLMAMSGGPAPPLEIEVPTAEDVVIDLGSVRIAGFVRDEVGESPMPEATVRLERVEAQASDPFSGRVHGSGARTDSRGYFSLNAEPGIWRVIATKAGYGPAESTVDVTAGGSRDNLELRLLPTDGVSFDVLTDSGEAPPQVLTAVLDPSGRAISQGPAPVGEGGTVRLSTVPAGAWELLVQAGDSAVARRAISAPGHVGQVRLSRGGNLRIRVPALAGGPEQRAFNREHLAQVRLTGPDGRPHVMLESYLAAAPQWPMWNGEAMISRLSTGVWRFTIEHPDGRSWSGEATVVAGETSEVVVP